MVQGASVIVKYLLFFFNLVFVITGLALIIVGAIVEARARSYLIFLGGSTYASTAILLIILGLIVFGIAFLGCCGAVKENHCMIMTFSVFLFIIFIMELSGGIAAYAYRGKLDGIAEDALSKIFESAKEETNSTVAKDKGHADLDHWIRIQKDFDCCGLHNASNFVDDDTESIPEPFRATCCPKQNPTEDCFPSQVKREGCKDAMVDYFRDNIGMIGGAGIGVAFIEVLGIIFACCLARAIKKEYEVV